MLIRSLKGDYAFRRLRKGKAGYSRLLSIRWLPHNEGCVRVGIIVTKKIGKATTRNLVRRRLREALRAILKEKSVVNKALHKQLPSLKLVIIPKPETASCDYWQLKTALEKAMNRAGLLA